MKQIFLYDDVACEEESAITPNQEEYGGSEDETYRLRMLSWSVSKSDKTKITT
jgi:hypothetical protein